MEILNLTTKAGNKETILKAINSMTRESYIDVFCEYVLETGNKKDLNVFERGYLKDLNSNLRDFSRDLLMCLYRNKDKNKLLEIVINLAISAPYTFESYVDNNELDLFIRDMELPSEVKFSIVKNYMTSRLDAYCLSLEKTAADKAREQKKNQLERYERNIKHYQEQIEKLKEDLGL